MSDKTLAITGGCLCGAVRYEASGEPISVIHCHCLSCRRHTGAPVVTLAGFRRDQVEFTDLVIAKKSSPQLWKEHIAEDEIGASYDEIDAILYCTFEKKMTIDETVKTTQIEKKIVDKIYQLYKNSQHKRITAARP